MRSLSGANQRFQTYSGRMKKYTIKLITLDRFQSGPPVDTYLIVVSYPPNFQFHQNFGIFKEFHVCRCY